MFSTIQIKTANGWRPINLFKVTNLERDAADVAENKAKQALLAAKAMPRGTDFQERERHIAILSAHDQSIKADSFRKGARRYERQ